MKITDLDQFKKFGSFGPSYPPMVRRFFSPDDDVHGALMMAISNPQLSVFSAMFGYDDEEVNNKFLEFASNPKIPFVLCLDKTQAAGVHEKKLIALFPTADLGNSLVIGKSRVHSQISHTKLIVIDGIITIGGSTNLSVSGENQQNNEMIIIIDSTYAAETIAKIMLIHSEMQGQMNAR